MTKAYDRPPIEEAVCEFRLADDTAWDVTLPGLLYDRVKKEYPHREPVVRQELRSELTDEGSHQQLGFDQGVRLLGPEKHNLILIYPRRVVVGRLRPYESWNGFQPEISRVFGIIRDLTEVDALERLGLRYINKIEIPGSRVDLDDYFEFKLTLGDRLPQTMGSFFAGAQFVFEDGRDNCRIRLTPTPAAGPDAIAVLLDLDYYLSEPRTVPPSDALTWVDEAHSTLGDLFEGCITDKLRELFAGEA